MKPRQFFCFFITVLAVSFFCGCGPDASILQKLAAQQSQIDSLRQKLDQIKPGLGEIMAVIQTHHAKLWFAGINENWKLADFEVKEIKEMVDMAENIETDRPETKFISMINPSLDTIAGAIQKNNTVEFKHGFSLLTAACNNCHKDNNFEFNVITIPVNQPVTNQDFRSQP